MLLQVMTYKFVHNSCIYLQYIFCLFLFFYYKSFLANVCYKPLLIYIMKGLKYLRILKGKIQNYAEFDSNFTQKHFQTYIQHTNSYSDTYSKNIEFSLSN